MLMVFFIPNCDGDHVCRVMTVLNGGSDEWWWYFAIMIPSIIFPVWWGFSLEFIEFLTWVAVVGVILLCRRVTESWDVIWRIISPRAFHLHEWNFVVCYSHLDTFRMYSPLMMYVKVNLRILPERHCCQQKSNLLIIPIIELCHQNPTDLFKPTHLHISYCSRRNLTPKWRLLTIYLSVVWRKSPFISWIPNISPDSRLPFSRIPKDPSTCYCILTLRPSWLCIQDQTASRFFLVDFFSLLFALDRAKVDLSHCSILYNHTALLSSSSNCPDTFIAHIYQHVSFLIFFLIIFSTQSNPLSLQHPSHIITPFLLTTTTSPKRHVFPFKADHYNTVTIIKQPHHPLHPLTLHL